MEEVTAWMNRSSTFSLPESVLELVDDVKCKRRGPTRSDTVRILLLHGLAALGYLPNSQKKALGIKTEKNRKGGEKT